MKKLLLIFIFAAACGFVACDDSLGMPEEYFIPPGEESPEAFYVYFRFVNASSHPVELEINEGGCIVWNAYLDAGCAYVHSKFDYNGKERPFGFGFLGLTFDPCLTEDSPDSGPSIYYGDFDVVSSAPNLGDRSQWVYEKLDGRHSRWTYTITDEDYQIALQQ